MSIRKAVYEDLDTVMQIKEKVVPLMIAAGNSQWSDDYPNRERFSRDIEAGSLYVYEEAGTTVGFVVVDDDHPYPYDDIPWSLTRENSKAMHRMAVDPSKQGHGIARRMMAAMEAHIRSEGYGGIHTDTSLENEKMQKQFERNGYQFKGKLNLDDNEDDWYVAYEKTFD
ncbi:GNAT family N-acetyltransferase [Salinicoccus sp. ID82-1]|uniref:GNAT family N-acetyltransferase n=1 Tax=Salinicoccus cyprini TaxID=2493691 RepID=A0A558AQZ9_9STAP|nr:MULTISPECIES: GNAT family N-acetyltransferase [Salinicoccus]MCG1010261.1 GNAT family N-acetyltransferase [Salinicoccus sp. ID82-1]TVT26685.1 GNAT family N-acetyltransferase [Salinicoccus cyprini]